MTNERGHKVITEGDTDRNDKQFLLVCTHSDGIVEKIEVEKGSHQMLAVIEEGLESTGVGGKFECWDSKEDLKCTIEVKESCEESLSNPLSLSKWIDKVTVLKEDGNCAIKYNISEASKLYESSIRLTDNLVKEYSPNPELEILKSIKSSCNLNLALCYFRLKRFADAVTATDKVLDTSPQNEKALYRKALALSELHNHEQSVECLNTLIEIYPNNTEAVRELSRIQSLSAAHDKKEAKLFSNLFNN